MQTHYSLSHVSALHHHLDSIPKMNSKLQYLIKCASLSMDPSRMICPSCGGKASTIVARKYFFTALRRCSNCKLLFRTPTTNAEENAAFYQKDYSQGFTTDVPSDSELEILKSTDFKGCAIDYSNYIAVLEALGVTTGQRILDFGCSWGYGSYQLQQHGFSVTAFEISEPRCR